jgi:hypothetical protein
MYVPSYQLMLIVRSQAESGYEGPGRKPTTAG